ncbi:MAG TPA: sodium:proton antiporter [Methylomirabilota bacterium]|jgi:multicomponent Na+:H+ antiporter subunit C|nr:sodium:proton antiporter [Methylomirabilota bacterium]
MNLVVSLAAAVLFGAGAYLLLKRDLVRVVVGVSLISQSAILTLLASALTRGQAPIYPLADAPVSDPVVQSLALTALVIGLAVTALLLVVVDRVSHAYYTITQDDVAATEAARDAELERAGADAEALTE